MISKLTKSRYFGLILILISVVWTFLLYFQIVSFDFVNWDDNAYVFQNNDITELSPASISKFFSSFYLGMYQPIIMLSFALEFSLAGLNPAIYHSTNLAFHLLNVALVFIFIKKLSGSNLSAFIVSLFFGIHPIHVESVAWISERKDVIYTFFYLLGLISYIHYLKVNKSRFWMLSIGFFILSLLSKSAAVTFPLVLVLLHFYYQRDTFNLKRTVLKVWPFFVLSLIFGLLSFVSQKTFNSADVSNVSFNFINRIVLVGFSYFTYIFHLVAPSVFSAVHPLPNQSGYFVPVLFYLYFALALIVLYLAYYFYKHGSKNRFFYDILFGFLFFTVTIFLILYNPATKAVYADRYTYLPYIGLLFAVLAMFQYFFEKSFSSKFYVKIISVTVFLILSLMYSVNTFSFIGNWKNSLSLWNKSIENEPSAISYFCRAKAKSEQLDINGALQDYQNAIRSNDHLFQAYTNIAAIEIEKSNYAEALIYLNKVISINPSLAEAYFNRGLVFNKLNKIPESIIEFSSAIKIYPKYEIAYYSRAQAYAALSNYNLSLNDVTTCLQFDPKNHRALSLRGYLMYKFNRFTDAMDDLNRAILLKPDYLLAYNNRALVYRSLQDNENALQDLNYLLAKDPEFATALLTRGEIFIELNDKEKACIDLNKAFKAGISKAGALMKEHCN